MEQISFYHTLAANGDPKYFIKSILVGLKPPTHFQEVVIHSETGPASKNRDEKTKSFFSSNWQNQIV
jgi:hypothetical protein